MAQETRFAGVMTALVTPFAAGGGGPDLAALDRLVERQCAAGVGGIVVCATTGEGGALAREERRAVIERCVARAAGRCRVIAGTGTNATPATVELTRMAGELGCDGALVVTPYYNRPTQAGLLAHFAEVCAASPVPVVLYNVPSRTGVDLLPETVAAAAAHPRCAGIKEATGNMVRALEIRRRAGAGFALLSGDDATFLPFLACGGDGIISTTSNVAPGKVVEVWRRWRAGDAAGAREAHDALLDLYAAMFVESNPGPVKHALARMGLIAPEIRLPLVLPDPGGKNAAAIDAALRSLGLLP